MARKPRKAAPSKPGPRPQEGGGVAALPAPGRRGKWLLAMTIVIQAAWLAFLAALVIRLR
jgi:hypothetical protein